MDKRVESLFVIGNPRSGTSLLRIMLNSHDHITIPPECGYIHWWYDIFKNWDKNSNVSDFIKDFKTSKKIETWGINFNELEVFLKSKTIENYASLVKCIIEFYGENKLNKTTQKVLGDKNNYYIKHLDELNKIVPSSNFLFLIRDPKDVFCSYKGISNVKSNSKYIPKLTNGIMPFIEEWTKNHLLVLNFIKNTKNINYHVVFYDELVLDTEITLFKICQFLKMDFDHNMLKYFEHNDEPEELLGWKKKTLKPPDPKSVGRYKKDLTESEISEIDKKTNTIFNLLREYS